MAPIVLAAECSGSKGSTKTRHQCKSYYEINVCFQGCFIPNNMFFTCLNNQSPCCKFLFSYILSHCRCSVLKQQQQIKQETRIERPRKVFRPCHFFFLFFLYTYGIYSRMRRPCLPISLHSVTNHDKLRTWL